MKCPGQDTQYWKPGAIYDAKCPECGHPVEFFKDDTTRKCGRCGHRFLNPHMDFGCASYCQYAEQCIGNLPPELLAQKEDLLKDRVAIEMKRYLRADFKRIGRATRVARYAERIGMAHGGNLAVILCAAYLLDIGAPEAQRRHGSTAAEFLEREGPPIAASILEKLSAGAELIAEVREIIARRHHPRTGESDNFKVVYDAERLAELEEKQKKEAMAPEALLKIIEASCLTAAGRTEAQAVLLGAP